MATVKLMDLSVSAWSAAADGRAALVISFCAAFRRLASVSVEELPHLIVCLQFATQNRYALLLELLVCLPQSRTQNRYALLLELL